MKDREKRRKAREIEEAARLATPSAPHPFCRDWLLAAKYRMLRAKGIPPTEAVARLADKYDIGVATVRKAIAENA